MFKEHVNNTRRCLRYEILISPCVDGSVLLMGFEVCVCVCVCVCVRVRKRGRERCD